MSGSVNVQNLTVTIERELTIYNKGVAAAIKKECKKAMDELVKETKATAPVGRRKRHYRDNIKSKKLSESDRAVNYLWYVDGSDARLSHLLENGHATRNGGRVAGLGFIRKAEKSVTEKLEKKIEAIIENGG